MKKAIKVVIVLFSLLAVLAVSLYLFTDVFTDYHLQPSMPYNDYTLQEKIFFTSAFYNSTQNSVSMVVQAMNNVAKNSSFQGLIIKDQSGNVVVNAPISDTLNGLELTTITFKLDNTLLSGNYTATLTTTKGGSFVSPSFTVP